MGKSRIEYLDFAKAIGIILVVFNHLWQSSGKEDFIFLLISSFHMPLFFFLSGLFFNVAKYTFVDFIYKRFRQLFIPCICFSLMVGITDLALSDGLFFINMTHKLPGAIWFLLILFIVEILYWPIGYMLTNVKGKLRGGVALCVVIILLICGYMLQINGYGKSLYSLASVFYALMFYMIGNMSCDLLIGKGLNGNYEWWLHWLYIIVCGISLCAIVMLFHVRTILINNTISPLIPGIAASFLGIMLILLISLQIEAVCSTQIKGCLSSIGKNTLVIMSFHQIYMKLFVEYFKMYFTSFVLYQSVKIFTMTLFLYIMVKLINRQQKLLLGK